MADSTTQKLWQQLQGARGFNEQDRLDAREEKKRQEQKKAREERAWIESRTYDILSRSPYEPTDDEVYHARQQATRERREIVNARHDQRREDLFYAALTQTRDEVSPAQRLRQIQRRIRKNGAADANDRGKYQYYERILRGAGNDVPPITEFLPKEED